MSRRTARLIGLTAAALVLLAPHAALACSVCIGGESADTRIAYRAMTAFMTFTPLVIVGGVIFWIYRRYKALDAEHEAHRAMLAGAPSPRDLGRG